MQNRECTASVRNRKGQCPLNQGEGGELTDFYTLSTVYRLYHLYHRTLTFFLETGFQLRPEQTGRLCVAAAAAGLMRSVLPPSS